jgi:branched-chain amino acid transport system substrate-binding protein
VHDAKPTAIVHCGFGFGMVFINPALEALNWDPARFTSTAFQNAWINPVMWNAFMGWTGVDQYDEGNLVGQRFLDQYQAAYGRRPRVVRSGREQGRRRHAAACTVRRASVEPARCEGSP